MMEELERAAEDFVKDFANRIFYETDVDDEIDLSEQVKRTFIAGAKWQKEQDNKELSEKIATAYQLGIAHQKEQMLKEAVECDLYYDGDFLAIDLNMAELGYSERDKIRIIVLKNTEK